MDLRAGRALLELSAHVSFRIAVDGDGFFKPFLGALQIRLSIEAVLLEKAELHHAPVTAEGG